MRILHITAEITRARGGPVTALHALVELWHGLGHEQAILAIKGHTAEATFPSHTPVHLFPRRWPQSFLRSPDAIDWLRREAAQFDLIVVHEVWPLLVIDSLRVLANGNTPYVLMPHASLDPDICYGRKALLKRFYIATVLRKAVRKARAIWAASSMEASRLLRFGEDTPVRLTPLPVAAPDVRPERQQSRQNRAWAAGEFVVLFVGRFHRVKGLDLLIDALRQAQPRAPGLRLVLAGGGDQALERALVEKAQALGVADRVQFTGFVDTRTRAELLAGADLFALPSERENFGIAVVEALQFGLPVLLTPHVGIAPDVVQAGAGWVVERTVEALADKIVALANTPESISAAREKAIETAVMYAPTYISNTFKKEIDLIQEERE